MSIDYRSSSTTCNTKYHGYSISQVKHQKLEHTQYLFRTVKLNIKLPNEQIHKSENFTPTTHPAPSILLNKSLEAEQRCQDITQEQFQATFSIKNMAVLK